MNFLFLLLPILITVVIGLPVNETKEETNEIPKLNSNLTNKEKTDKEEKSLVTLCDEICIHNGKSGWFFSIWDIQLAGVYKDSDCKCTCPVPVREEAHVEICRRPNECDNLCKSNQFQNYSLGGSCRGSDTCVCKCGVDEKYDDKKGWFLRESPYFEYGIHDHNLDGVNDFEEDQDMNGIPDHKEDEREGQEVHSWNSDIEEFHQEESFFRTPTFRAWAESTILLMIIGGVTMGGGAAVVAAGYGAPGAYESISGGIRRCISDYMPTDFDFMDILGLIETLGLGPLLDYVIETFECLNLQALIDMLTESEMDFSSSESLDTGYNSPIPSYSANPSTLRPYSSPTYYRASTTRAPYSTPDFGSYGSSGNFAPYNYPYYQKPIY